MTNIPKPASQVLLLTLSAAALAMLLPFTAHAAGAGAKVADSVRKGGTGKLGQIPMPAQPALSEAGAKTLADGALNGAK